MNIKFSQLIVFLCAGAALPGSAEVAALQALLQDPESLLGALGAVRVRREAGYQHEWTFDSLGLGAGFSKLGQNKAKAYLKIPLRRLVPVAHSDSVDLRLDWDGGANDMDGVFTAVVVYTLEHKDGGHEEGTLRVNRQRNSDGNFVTKVGSTPNQFILLTFP